MSNPISIRLEIRGRPQELGPFKAPMKELEKSETNVFDGTKDIEWISEEWRRELDVENHDKATVYSWISRHPDRFVRSLAVQYPTLTFVATMADEAESFVGTSVLINETLVNSYSEFPSDAHDPNPAETPLEFYKRKSNTIEALSFLNYKMALAKLRFPSAFSKSMGFTL